MTIIPKHITISEVLELIGYNTGDRITIGSSTSPDDYRERVIDVADVQAEIGRLAGRNTWFSLNPPGQPVGSNRRGGEREFTRLNGLPVDLDVKPGGCATFEVAQRIIDDLSEILCTRPVVITSTGHGLQPIWALEDCDDIEIGIPLLRRFGRMVSIVAESRKARVDNVFDMARILRCAGTVNVKSEPVLATAVAGGGSALTVEQVDDRLLEMGIYQLTDDADTGEPTVVSPPEQWIWNECSGCRYTPAMVAAWATDTPTARNPWLFSKKIKIEAARRYGCFPDRQAYLDAHAALDRRYPQLFLYDGSRQVRRVELQDTGDRAVTKVATFTDEKVRMELGNHYHLDQMAGGATQSKTGSAANPAAPPPKTNGAATKPRLWRASELKPATQPKWLAKNRIPQAAVTILIGEEGIGKSLLWVLIAAAVTTGKPMPEFGIPPRDPADVVLILTEDEWSTAVLPRLIVAGADIDRVRVICTDDDGSGSPTFPDDMATILDADPAPAMVVVDAWLDTVPGNLRAGDPQQSRQALHPWKEAASVTAASMMLLTHANRLGTANIRDKYGVTASLRQKARMTLYCLPGDNGGFIVGPDKSNGASARTRASKFRIKSVQHFDPTPDHDGTVPLLEFVAESDKTIKEHLAEIVEAERGKGKPPSAAEVWLRGQLEGGERKQASQLYKAAVDDGFSVDQIKRAKANINKGSAVRIVATKDADDGRWYWAMIQQTGEGE